MGTNKKATIRYHALDTCFSNFRRKFYIEDLVDACNDAINENNSLENGVKKRQVYNDISFMESEQGYSIPLVKCKDGKRTFFRYEDKNFSIKNMGLNASEAEQLSETLTILSRFKGLPQFDWIEETQIRLNNILKLNNPMPPIIGFEQNLYLKGLNYLSGLFSVIQNETCLEISYHGFKNSKPYTADFHPWFLKQYNNRWFIFGLNENLMKLSNLALDRIVSFKESPKIYKPNTQINFEEYFEDVVGVTVSKEAAVEKIIIKVGLEAWPYLETKP